MSTGCRGGCEMARTGLSVADDCTRFTDNIKHTVIWAQSSTSRYCHIYTPKHYDTVVITSG